MKRSLQCSACKGSGHNQCVRRMEDDFDVGVGMQQEGGLAFIKAIELDNCSHYKKGKESS